MLAPQRLEENETVGFRHHQIEDDSVGRKTLPQALECLAGRQTRLHRESLVHEFDAIHVEEELVVIQNEYGARALALCVRRNVHCSVGSFESMIELNVFTSENGIFISNAFIIASSRMVYMPPARATDHNLDSTGFSRTTCSSSLVISSNSKTAMRPRIPVGQVGVRTASYTAFGTLNRYFSGSVDMSSWMLFISLGVSSRS